jgi:hypothetical protein
MMINAIEGATRRLGKSQGYLGLPVKDIDLEGVPAMVTSWQPTPAELAALAAGAPIYVTILGNQHPPIMVGIGPTPIEEEPR